MNITDHSIATLESENYQGNDASLRESLFCYGLIWKQDGEDLRFIYGIKTDSAGDFIRFDWACIKQNTNPEREWNWVKWADVANYCGSTQHDFLKLPLTDIVTTLVQYYGYEEIFGTSYTEGFTVEA